MMKLISDPILFQGFAKELSDEVKALGIPVDVINMKDYDPDDQLAVEVRPNQYLTCIFPVVEKDIVNYAIANFCSLLDKCTI